MNQNNNKHIAKEFSNSPKREQIFLTNDFNETFFKVSDSPELIYSASIVFRLIFKIINDTRNQENSFNSKDAKANPIQYSLFENMYKTNDNTYASFSYKISELDKNRNYAALQNALSFLESYKKGWHTYQNRQGKEFKFLGGFLTDITYTKGKVSFLINSYWIEKILLSDEYNDVLISAIEYLKEPKYILFYLWLLRLPEKGTKVNYQTIVKSYDLKYDNYADLYKNFLYPLRVKLNACSNYSFNISKEPKGSIVGITRQSLAPKIGVSIDTYTKLKVREKLAYYKGRHSLNDVQVDSIKKILSTAEGYSFFNEAYAHFVKNCRNKKVSAASFLEQDFIHELQGAIYELKGSIKLI